MNRLVESLATALFIMIISLTGGALAWFVGTRVGLYWVLAFFVCLSILTAILYWYNK